MNGLPEDGDVRNTVLFRENVHHLTTISVNQFIYDLMIVAKHHEENAEFREKNNRTHPVGFHNHDLAAAFDWESSPQGDIWYDIYRAINRHKYARR